MLARRALLAFAMACGVAARARGQAASAAEVEVMGAVHEPLRLDAAALAAFAPEQQVDSSVTRHVQGADERRSSVRGVRLTAVLERARLDEHDRLDARKAVVLCTASDGYRAVLSWMELFNTEGGRQVLLAYRRDGEPLDAREGPIALIALGDLSGGPRHVRNLRTIEVRVLRD